MELVRNLEDISKLNRNKFLGEPELINTRIQFAGENNILVCEGDIKLINANISFNGSNSIIYLSYSQVAYRFNIIIRNRSALFIGKNNKMGIVDIHVEEHQNLIMGDDSIIGSGVSIRTCDSYPIYDFETKQRINYSDSILIGDHVWIDNRSYVSKGSRVGSGSITGVNSYLPPNTVVHSNTLVQGNPIQLLKEDVFFTKDFVGSCTAEDTLNYSTYKSNIFQYEYADNEKLSFEKIDEILKNLTVSEKLDFIDKLLIKNKRKNRFYY